MVQALKPTDKPLRKNFCVKFQENLHVNGFENTLLFIDESTFLLCGKVNRHNLRYGGTENVQPSGQDSGPACHEFEFSTAEDPPCRQRCTLNLPKLKRNEVRRGGYQRKHYEVYKLPQIVASWSRSWTCRCEFEHSTIEDSPVLVKSVDTNVLPYMPAVSVSFPSTIERKVNSCECPSRSLNIVQERFESRFAHGEGNEHTSTLERCLRRRCQEREDFRNKSPFRIL
ncbi:uncharacterized protein TNCV_2534011 [Trichonephila clavipes]|nr:uncharacterized protein TNCV_2534011 [Trichonephila clavipes]